MEINAKLKEYIETTLFPKYQLNEIGHSIEHIKKVIERSFELVRENNLDVNPDIVYVVAAYHDIGHHIDPFHHELVSADIMSHDEELHRFFNKDELLIIKEAIEDHRASSKHEPRSIYGKIVSSADRNNNINDCLFRTYTYGKKLRPDFTDDELFERAYDALVNKFGENGYAKFFFKDSQYEGFLSEIRKLLSNKQVFIETQRKYIEQLKKSGEL